MSLGVLMVEETRACREGVHVGNDQVVLDRIRVGTAGWSYPDWKGQVYPKPQARGFDPLTYLAQYFDAVEINTTFYRIPSQVITRQWVERVSPFPAFRFTAKLWQGFTHATHTSANDAAAFRQAMAPIYEAGRLGAVLMQFPYRFHHTPDNREYLRRLVLQRGFTPVG